jgi:hypothetical protein
MISGTKIPREKKNPNNILNIYRVFFPRNTKRKRKKQTNLQLDQMPEGSPKYDRQ